MNAFAISGHGMPLSYTSLGVSEEARTLQKRIADVLGGTLGGRHEKNFSSLENVFDDCRSDNWDGYGAQAVTLDSYLEARRFSSLLPSAVPLPEISAEPDGEIAFEWVEGRENVFSVSVGVNKLTYAGLFGMNKIHGTEYFGDELPKAILFNLQRLFA